VGIVRSARQKDEDAAELQRLAQVTQLRAELEAREAKTAQEKQKEAEKLQRLEQLEKEEPGFVRKEAAPCKSCDEKRKKAAVVTKKPKRAQTVTPQARSARGKED